MEAVEEDDGKHDGGDKGERGRPRWGFPGGWGRGGEGKSAVVWWLGMMEGPGFE